MALSGPLEWPTFWASFRRETPVMSGSVPRKRAHDACADAATALLAPPDTFAGTARSYCGRRSLLPLN